MRIEVKGRNVAVTDDLRESVERRFEKVSKQVSEFAVLVVEFAEERNPANPDSCVAEATLQLKGVVLRATERSRDFKHALNLVADDMSRQVKRHRDKRRKRREARAGSPRAGAPAPMGEASAPPA
jgi:putative sigma-54 modulation protein